MTLRTCSKPGCGKKEAKEFEFKNCSGCKQSCYCSKECQVGHWKGGHKRQCKQLQAQRKQESMPASWHKELMELRKKYGFTMHQLQEVQAKLAATDRTKKRTELVLKELGTLSNTHTTYKAIGKMYLKAPCGECKADVRKQSTHCDTETSRLQKKERYLKKQITSIESSLGELQKALSAA